MRIEVMPHSGYLSVVLVGLGHIAAKHAAVLAQHPRIRLVATVDPLQADSLQAERTGFFASLDETVVHGTDLGAVLDALNVPVGAPVDAPAPESVDAPVPGSVDAPVPRSVDAPVPRSVHAPVSVDAPVPGSVDALVPESVDAPVPGSVDTPVPESVDTPVHGSVDGQRRLVLVATPNGTHIPLARLAIDRGWHVLVEKPLGLDPTACADLVDAARSRGRVLAVAMQNRFGPAVRALKERVDRGQLGALRMVQIECLWNRDEKYYNASAWRGTRAMDGGVLFTQFSHFIDLLLWLLGRPSDFSLMASNQAHPGLELDHDSGVLSMRWPNGTLGTMVYTTAAPPGRASSGFTLLGSAAGVRLSGQYMDRLEWLTPDGTALTAAPTDPLTVPADPVPATVSGATIDFEPTSVSGATTDPPTTQFLMWDHLCGVILDQQALLLPPEEAMEVVRFIHDIHRVHS
ncbi:MAG: Gfo/Idh/MocA family oxidoreductase [Bacteroidota bacterium]